MNNAYLEKAKERIPDPQILSVVAAKRARQLAFGARPMIKCDSDNHLDVALLEIAEGLLGYEFPSENEAVSEAAEGLAAVLNGEAPEKAAADAEPAEQA